MASRITSNVSPLTIPSEGHDCNSSFNSIPASPKTCTKLPRSPRPQQSLPSPKLPMLQTSSPRISDRKSTLGSVVISHHHTSTESQHSNSTHFPNENPTARSVKLDLLSISPYALHQQRSSTPVTEFSPCSPRGRTVQCSTVWNSSSKFGSPSTSPRRPPELLHLASTSLANYSWSASLRSDVRPATSYCVNE
ncbi:hypothetical protein P9112_007691 [Eukaryota sp. TZLM1-RC]